MPRRGQRIEMGGLRFGSLTVVEFAADASTNEAKWICLCDCGRKHTVTGSSLRSGKTVTCGCRHNALIGASKTRHGEAGSRRGTRPSPTYMSWCSMNRRCRHPQNPAYPNYGGRGIAVCERWESFENFLADMGVQQLIEGPATHARSTLLRAAKEAREDAGAVDRLLREVYRQHAEGRSADDVLDTFHDGVAPWLAPTGVRRVDRVFEMLDLALVPEALGVLLLAITRLTRLHFSRRHAFLARFGAFLVGRGGRSSAQVEAMLRGLQA